MVRKLILLSSVSILAAATPAFAQEAAEDGGAIEEIVVVAQRQSERLQDVPIAVSALSAAALESRQVDNTSDLQLSLPSTNYTKTNFTSSSFTIRGIGDLCVGVSCDSATAIHINDSPLYSTRLFEGEFFDLEQIEVLRGPQGTLFGRNATSGVVNVRTARPKLGEFGGAVEGDFGNFANVKVKGMINLPLGETMALRFSGYSLDRKGYTKNLYDSSKIDDRNMYGFRAALRWEPGSSTTIDLMGQYFRENDHRLRIQKTVCQRDATGILGCLNAERGFEAVNANAQLDHIFASRELFAMRGLPTSFALTSLYGADVHAGAVNPANLRTVSTDFKPQYFTDELIIQGSLAQELGGGLNLKLSGNYQDVAVDSRQDPNLLVKNRALYTPALTALTAAGAGLLGAGLQTYLRPAQLALIPTGVGGQLCTSLAEPTGTGTFGGHRTCADTPVDFDRSVQRNSSWSAEAILSSDWDGKFNFLVGGIYSKYHLTENSFYASTFGLDYFAGVSGAFGALSNALPPAFLASPTFRNNSDEMKQTSYGLFGEGYYEFNDRLKLTVGARLNHDKKYIRARSTLFIDANNTGVLVPHGSDSITDANFYAFLDFDAYTPGPQAFTNRRATFNEWTGRAVLDYKISDDNLLYVSYSRGYKGGGINPPISLNFNVPQTYKPEFINAFEIGSKNNFGKAQLNLTAFHYQYKDLQLSRIVARTSVNDNVSANIWGLEAEAIVKPTRELTANLTLSVLDTKVSENKMLANPRDFGGGRSDAVIIKDITNAANCAVGSNVGSVAGVNAYVNTVNSLINTINGVGNPLTTASTGGLQPGAGLQPTTSFGANSGIASTGAFSVCQILNNLAGPVGGAFGGVTVYSAGIPVNLKGNQLPGAPKLKLSAGMQYEMLLDGVSITPRVDVHYNGKSTGSIFNGKVNAIPAYTQVNAQVQFTSEDEKWFARAYVQNLFDKNAITGLYVNDQQLGLATNLFTLEPRRWGMTLGYKF